MSVREISVDEVCYHCGNELTSEVYSLDDKQFCCAGCKGVYQVLSQNNLCSYYNYNAAPGSKQTAMSHHFDYLNEPSVFSKLIDYTDDETTLVTFYIPAIHCSSCLWLLEHLYKLNPGVVQSRVDFLKKQASFTFKHKLISLKELAELLVSIGYEPLISLQDVVKEKKHSVNRDLIRKIAVAGFCMGNVMLFTFPEYLGLSSTEREFQVLFGWLNLAFGVVVTFYCSSDFFVSALASIKSRMINLDVPLAIIVAVLFIRSAVEIIGGYGPGFTDSLSGLVFLLLLGRWVKQRTYNHISFNRDYRSYFPVAVTLIKDGLEKPLPIGDINVGDRILIRNNEIVPADSILMKGEGYFDFSFVTGESQPVNKVLGEIIYAGGRQIGGALEMEVVKPVSQSYLTRLWNNENFSASDVKMKNFNDTLAQYFSAVVLVIAFASFGTWYYLGDTRKAWDAFSAVLIIACPCVLALSTPLTLSIVIGLFDKNHFYLKNTDVVEMLAKINTVVFDKTGTITSPDVMDITFSGSLSGYEESLVGSAVRNSSHPLSREVAKWLKGRPLLIIESFSEHMGKGILARVDGHEVRVGSGSFVNAADVNEDSSAVYISIDGDYKGYFKLRQQWRTDLKGLIGRLVDRFSLHLISGDNAGEKTALKGIFNDSTPMLFKQSPHEKLNYIKDLQLHNNRVMMLGDGLNDAGALKQSDLGVAITDNVNNFTPGCDAILKGDALIKLPRFIQHAKDSLQSIRWSFVIASVYNLIGIFFAVQGRLAPLMAAVLMPLSTITIVTFTNIMNRLYARRNNL